MKPSLAARQAEGRVKLRELGNLIGELLETHPPATEGMCRVCGLAPAWCPATRLVALLADMKWRI